MLEAIDGSIDDAETVTLANNWVIVALMPVSLLPALSTHSDALYAYVIGPYLNWTGISIGMSWSTSSPGLAPNGADLPEPEPVLAEIRVTSAGYDNVRRF